MLKPTSFSALRRQSPLALGTALMCLASVVSAGPTLDHIRATGKIVLGHRESSVPFSYMDADKRPVGYALDLCVKLADAVKKKLEMKTLTVEYLMVTPQQPHQPGGRGQDRLGVWLHHQQR
jgi:ABC-type amino acid transport substrate-binding protein